MLLRRSLEVFPRRRWPNAEAQAPDRVRQAMNRTFQPLPHHETPCSRRDFLTRSGGGFGLLALLSLMERDSRAGESVRNQLAGRVPHFPATAKSVIWLFLDGGPSHIDLFDPK